jgi:hypothetical protein
MEAVMKVAKTVQAVKLLGEVLSGLRDLEVPMGGRY